MRNRNADSRIRPEEDSVLELSSWQSLAGFEKADLLLGNGFSRRICERLNYPSLFNTFLTSCSRKDQELFSTFDSSNFEFILDRLNCAADVCNLFGLDRREIDQASRTLRKGLIRAIETVHPDWASTDVERLRRTAADLDAFGNVFTLNYDTFLYHIILMVKDRATSASAAAPFSDYFWRQRSSHFLEFVDYQTYDYRLVYYLHGALFIFKEQETVLKLRRADDSPELLSLIRDTIERGRTPLFISEGTPREKSAAINRNRYLSFALEKLEEPDRPMVVYGCSLSDPDRHIVDAINRHPRNIAVSVHTAGSTHQKIADAMARYRRLLQRHRVEFFDADTLFA